MALTSCPECGRPISTSAAACPACGYPLAQATLEPSSDELLAEVRPSWWRYFGWLLFFWLVIPLLIAWMKRCSVRLRVYRGRVTLRRGLLSKTERELFMRDIRSIDIDQSFLGRLVNIGDLAISSAASSDATEHVQGVRNPERIRDIIVEQRQNGVAPASND
jgi:uncharacterized membrane protein YdbT with pleckstrin-like domain